MSSGCRLGLAGVWRGEMDMENCTAFCSLIACLGESGPANALAQDDKNTGMLQAWCCCSYSIFSSKAVSTKEEVTASLGAGVGCFPSPECSGRVLGHSGDSLLSLHVWFGDKAGPSQGIHPQPCGQHQGPSYLLSCLQRT